MSFRRCLLFLVSLTIVIAAGLPAVGDAAGACSPSTPQYCPPPKVKTGPAKHVTATSATLTGTVNPNGSDTSCFFEYGKTKSYGQTTPPQDVGSGTKTVTVTATVTGLKPKTTYHYQLVCSNLGGQAKGGDKKFKTHGLPKKRPTVTTERTKHHTATSARFRGTVNPNGSATTCWFQYGRTKHYGSKTPARSVGSGTKTKTVNVRATGLAPKTVYHYQLVCKNAGGQAHGRDRRTETLNQIRFRGSRTILVNRHGGFSVSLHCNGNHQCVGFVTLKSKGGKVLTRPVRFTVGAHKTRQVRMHLKPGALKQLTARHHLSGRLRARNNDGSSAHRRVTLRQR